jgi:hypothetical protein
MLLMFTVIGCTFCKAQSNLVPNPFDCGLTYFYDAAGNRILRMVVPCGSHSHHPDSTDVSQSSASVSDTVGIFQIVLLSPNPTQGPFHITCNQDLNNANVTVTDLMGKTVSQTTVSGRDVPMDISHLAPGTYQVIVLSNGAVTAKNIVKTTN